MKKLLYLIPFLASNLFAATVTSGRVGLHTPTTGYIDTNKSYATKLNENFGVIASTMNDVIGNLATATGTFVTPGSTVTWTAPHVHNATVTFNEGLTSAGTLEIDETVNGGGFTAVNLYNRGNTGNESVDVNFYNYTTSPGQYGRIRLIRDIGTGIQSFELLSLNGAKIGLNSSSGIINMNGAAIPDAGELTATGLTASSTFTVSGSTFCLASVCYCLFPSATPSSGTVLTAGLPVNGVYPLRWLAAGAVAGGSGGGGSNLNTFYDQGSKVIASSVNFPSTDFSREFEGASSSFTLRLATNVANIVSTKTWSAMQTFTSATFKGPVSIQDNTSGDMVGLAVQNTFTGGNQLASIYLNGGTTNSTGHLYSQHNAVTGKDKVTLAAEQGAYLELLASSPIIHADGLQLQDVGFITGEGALYRGPITANYATIVSSISAGGTVSGSSGSFATLFASGPTLIGPQNLFLVDTTNGKIGIGIGSGLSVPRSRLNVNSNSGTQGPILIISTGNGVPLFEVNGSSTVSKNPLYDASGGLISSFTAAANVAAGALGSQVRASSIASASVGILQINASGTSDNTTFLRGDGAWSVPPGSGGGSLPLAQLSTYYVYSSTDITGHVIHIPSATIHNLESDTMTIRGNQGVIQANSGPLQLKSAGGGTLEINTSSVQVTSNLNLNFNTTWYTGIAVPFFVGTSSQQIQNSTTVSNNLWAGDGVNSGTGTTNAAYFRKKIPTNFVAASTPVFTSLIEQSTGAMNQNRVYMVSFATAASDKLPQFLNYTSTVAYTATGTTNGAGETITRSVTPLNGVTNIIGSGDCILWMKASRDGNGPGDTSNMNPFIEDLGLGIPLRN